MDRGGGGLVMPMQEREAEDECAEDECAEVSKDMEVSQCANT